MTDAARVSRAEVVAFRIARHGLARRASRRTSLATVLPLGLQDTVDHAAAWALALRREDPRADDLAVAVGDGDLVPTWGPRLAAHLVPAQHEPRTVGALLDPDPDPDDDAGRLAGLAAELAPHALEQLRERGPLTKEDLGRSIAEEVPEWAMQDCERCRRRHPSEAVVKTLVWTYRIRLDPSGDTARRHGRVAPTCRWRPRRYRTPRDDDRADLARHYLRRHAPSNPTALAEWMGVARGYAARCWRLIEDELAPVQLDDGSRRWALAADLDELADPPPPPPARLLAAYDPLLQLRDRGTLVPDGQLRRQVWRAVANPGLVLVDGRVVATWRGRRRGRRLELRTDPVDALSGKQLGLLDADLDAVTTVVGADQTSVNPPS